MTTAVGRPAREVANERTRIVGARDGVIADSVVWAVRFAQAARSRAAGVARRLGRIVTALGWAVVVLGVMVFVVGYLLGWSEAILIAWTLPAVLAVAALHLIGRNSYDVQVAMPGNRVVVGQSASGGVLVRNQAHRRLPGRRIELPVGSGVAEFALPSLPSTASFEEEFTVPTAHRGVILVGPPVTVRADPIGLLRREIVWPGQLELFVHPRTIAIPSMSTGFVRDLEGSPTRDLTASDVSFHALREYSPGDDPRTIHWKSTAKTGSYMVRQFEETRRSHLLVAISLAEADYAADDEFELAVSVAGSLGVRAIRDGRTVSVVASRRTPDFAKRTVVAAQRLSTLTPSRLLDDLARIERVGAHLAIPELARIASDDAAGVSVAFLLCGSSVSVAQLRRASTQFPAGVEVVAVVCDIDIVPSFKRAGGLSILTVGYLEDLQKSLALARAA